jgi:hypothetical protein
MNLSTNIFVSKKKTNTANNEKNEKLMEQQQLQACINKAMFDDNG